MSDRPNPAKADDPLASRQTARRGRPDIGNLVRRLTGRKERPIVAVIRLAGVIATTPVLRRGHISMANMAGPIEAAFKIRGIVAVALAINSPGGSPVQSAMIQRHIRALAKERKVPVFAFAEDVAASGGYWLALAADEIYADQSSIIGSIGVISASFGFVGLLEKLGVERRLYKQGERKSMLDPFLPEQVEDVERLLGIQKDIYGGFTEMVKERRGDKLAKRKAKEIFSGEVWTGRRAVELGLIDGLGDLREVMRERYGDDVKFRAVSRREGWLARRIGFTRQSPASDLAEQLIAQFEARAAWARFGL